MAEIGAAAIRDKYTGSVAEFYEAKRSHELKWAAENAAVEKWLGLIGAGAHVLDIPVGTGRFLDAYRRHGMTVIGMDVSSDMLAQAQLKDDAVQLRFGDIQAIDMPAFSVDVAISLRIMNWLEVSEVRIALAELSRVAREWIITSGGRSVERSMIVRNLTGFTVFDEAPIDRDKRGYYSLMLLRRVT